jgi:hypothetical protein
MYDEFDRAHRPPLMPAAELRVAELRGDVDEAPAPRQTNPIAGPTRAPAWLVPLLVVATLGLVAAVFAAAPRTALVTEPTPAVAPTSPWAPTEAPAPALAPPAPAQEPAAPTVAPEPAQEGIGTGQGFIEPVGAPQAAPVGVGSPPPPPQLVNPTAEPVISDLVALPADEGLGSREKPCTHPSCEVAP